MTIHPERVHVTPTGQIFAQIKQYYLFRQGHAVHQCVVVRAFVWCHWSIQFSLSSFLRKPQRSVHGRHIVTRSAIEGFVSTLLNFSLRPRRRCKKNNEVLCLLIEPGCPTAMQPVRVCVCVCSLFMRLATTNIINYFPFS